MKNPIKPFKHFKFCDFRKFFFLESFASCRPPEAEGHQKRILIFFFIYSSEHEASELSGNMSCSLKRQMYRLERYWKASIPIRVVREVTV